MADTGQNISALIENNRVIVCCGSGGVGKTTTSAALAMRAAALGKRTVVITIDPAKRLATSLGLKGLSPQATDLTDHVNQTLEFQSLKPLSGHFFAVMPDTAQTFEHFVRTMAGSDEGLASRVLKNSIYKVFAKEFSGTNEYMAMEKLYQLYVENKYDLIVLDTPPSANTRTFLEAPDTLAGFFDERIIKWFIRPGSRFVATGLKKALELLERVTGQGFISQLLEFTAALFELRGQFMENLQVVAKLLRQKDVAFLMVTSPERLSKNDTQEFVRLLHDRNYHFWGFIVNRVLSLRLGLQIGKPIDLDFMASAINSAKDAKTLKTNFNQLSATLEHEKDAAYFLNDVSGRKGNVSFMAEQPSDVHSVSALLKIAQQLH